MAYVYRHKRGGWYVVITLPAGNRARIYLGMVNKHTAESVARKIGSVVSTNQLGQSPTPEVAAWFATLAVNRLPLLDRLEFYGLLQQWTRPTALPTVAHCWNAYLAKRTDYAAGTIKGWKTAWRHGEPRFGSRPIDSITVADAKDFARDLSQVVASTHAEKIVNRLSMVMADAVDSGLIAANPFASVKITTSTDKTKRKYLAESDALKVLDGFAHLEGQVLFALARWCGLRVPHEPLALRWTDIDWAKERLTIPLGTKTGFRVVPLFAIPLKHLRELSEHCPSGSIYVFNKARASAATEWRRWLEAAIRSAHVEPWSDLWVNLRRSARTDLEDRFPSHVCDAWLGHSTRVAKDHYLMVTEEHWQAAKQPPARMARPPRARRSAWRRKG